MENIHKNGVGMGKNKVEMDRNPLRTGSKWSKDVFKMQFKKIQYAVRTGLRYYGDRFKIQQGQIQNKTRTD